MQELLLQQKNTWQAMPKLTQELMLTNLCEMITEHIQKKHQVLKEQREGFDYDNDEVHAKLQHELFRGNSHRARKQELTSNNSTTYLDHQANIQKTSQTTNMSFDYSQRAFVQVMRMLDSIPPSLDNSQELILGLEPWSAQSPDLASRLSLSLD